MSNLKIHNSLTKSKLEAKFTKEVNMYTCGVTVYDECHIGHARSLYIFDVVRRYLEYKGYKVNFVRNITDIDDKIIKRAKELKVTWSELVAKHIDSYNKDLLALGIRKGILDQDKEEPKATNNIAEIISYIETLINKGYAYVTDSGVYFSVRKFKNYGKLSGQSIDKILSGVRIEADEKKQDPLDFALWKKSKEGEPSWASPWGQGRPGWHIECSVMSQKYLKVDTLDIHGGGRDLIFPHHENELAQSEAITNKPFAKFWIHHGLLAINGQKMAKSLGNFVTIKDVLAKYPADVLKLFYLQAHYSSSIDFSWERMDEAKKAYERLINLKNILEKRYGDTNLSKGISWGTNKDEGFKQEFIDAMDDDFNMPKGIAVLFDMVNKCNALLESSDSDKENKLAYALDVFRSITNVFNLTFIYDVSKKIPDTEIEEKIKLRITSKKEKDFEKADAIRKELEERGVILEDKKDGTTSWRRKI